MKVAFCSIAFALLVGIFPSANAWFVGTQAGGQWLQSHAPEVIDPDRHQQEQEEERVKEAEEELERELRELDDALTE